MKTIVFTGGKLFIICAVAAFALGLVNSVTEPIAEARRQKELEEALPSNKVNLRSIRVIIYSVIIAAPIETNNTKSE